MTDQILDPFHRQLAREIGDEIERRKEALAGGAAKRTTDGTETVAERYAESVGAIQAMLSVLDVAARIERDQLSSGTRPAKIQYD